MFGRMPKIRAFFSWTIGAAGKRLTEKRGKRYELFGDPLYLVQSIGVCRFIYDIAFIGWIDLWRKQRLLFSVCNLGLSGGEPDRQEV